MRSIRTATLVLALFATSCASTVVTAKDTGHGGDRAAPSEASAPAAKVGDTITLAGSDSSEQIAVTVVKVTQPAQAANKYSEPPGSKEYVAVELKLKNVGEATYSDSPTNGAELVDSKHRQTDALIPGSVKGELSAQTKLSPGDTRVGAISFEVAKGTKPAEFQFGLDSGFGPQTGEWSL